MKEIITDYLNDNYRMTLSSYVSFMIEDKEQKINVSSKEVIVILMEIFAVSEDEVNEIFDAWADTKQTILNNKIADLRYMLYEKTGVELQLTPADLNKLIEEEENRLIEGLNNLDNELRIPIP